MIHQSGRTYIPERQYARRRNKTYNAVMSENLSKAETLSSCPLCGSEHYYHSHPPDICMCNKCRIHFRNPRPYENEIVDCYDKGETFKRWQSELDIRSYLWIKRLSLITSYRKSGSLLDVGTGDGYFLGFAGDIFDVESTEISKSGCDYAKRRGHTVHYGTILDPEFNKRKYDVITMWHVLEHLSNPREALYRAKELLNPGGLMFIAVPNELCNLYSLGALLKKRHPFGRLRCDEEIHLTHYTPRTLAHALESVYGMNVLEVGIDDVHVNNRKYRVAGMYINKVLGKLLGFHLDKAMVIVCAEPNK